MTAKVDYLKKISIHVIFSMETEPDHSGDRQAEFELIYGIGKEGITPFEKAIYGKTPGDEFSVQLNPGETYHYFEHLNLPGIEGSPVTSPYVMKAEIKSVTTPDNNEIVKAMASRDKDSCAGSGCDCGCGCS